MRTKEQTRQIAECSEDSKDFATNFLCWFKKPCKNSVGPIYFLRHLRTLYKL